MDTKIVITSLIPTIVTFLVAWLGHKYDFKGIVKRTEIENKDDLYHSWREFSDTQKAAYDSLKAEFDSNKLEQAKKDAESEKKTAEMTRAQAAISEKLSRLQYEFDEFRKNAAEKEQGYQIRIEQLETENEDLKEKVEVLQGENETLLNENAELKGGKT